MASQNFPHGVAAVFQDLDVPVYAFVPEKPPSLVVREILAWTSTEFC
nr:hypothetical protein [Desulfuromonadales bacterium]